MAAFSYVRPGGIWSAGIPVLHGELTQLDQDHFKAPNFAEGGTYAPSSAVILGGAGLNVTADCTFGGNPFDVATFVAQASFQSIVSFASVVRNP